MLIFVKNLPPNPDARINAMRFQRGHVITIQEDGHAWGDGDLNNGHAKLVKLPTVPPDEVYHLQAMPSEQHTAPGTRPVLRQLRIWRVRDVNALSNELTRDDLDHHFEMIPPIPDPNAP